MASEQPGADNFLAMIEARIAALILLKESYVAAVSVGAFGQAGEIDLSSLPQMNGGKSFDLPTGALLGKSLPQAIKLYLGAVKKKQTATALANALKEGGVESTAANFLNNVTSTLHRLKVAGDVLQFKDGWALAEFYPESLRNRISRDAAPKAKAKKKRGKKKKTSKTAAGAGLGQRIVSYLQTRGTDFTAVQELASQLKTKPAVLNLMLGRMLKKETVEKNQEGRYRLAKAA